MKPPARLLLVARKLGSLRERVVFVGGMIRGLLTTDPAAAPMRPTEDVDMITGTASLADYYALGEELRARDFHEDSTEGAPLCRWVVDGVKADIMPIDPSVLGSSNVWFESAQRHAVTTVTEEGEVHHIDGPHFCATKLEAFASRAKGDYLHHDLEDFIGLVDERPALVAEIAACPQDTLRFIATTTRDLLVVPGFLDLLPGHLAGDEASQGRLPALIQKLRKIAALFDGKSEAVLPQPTITRVSMNAGLHGASRPTARWGFAPTPMHVAPGPGQPGRVYVQSSNLHWVEYDETTRQMIIGFLSGREYGYSGVPAGVHQGLLAAYSKGRYFHLWIRKRYGDRRLR